MKYIFFLLLSAVTMKTTLGQTRFTPTGVSVPVTITVQDFSARQIAYSDSIYEVLILNSGWDATIIGHSSKKYNCHGYAWHISDAGDTVDIETPDSYYFNGSNPSYLLNTDTTNLSKVYYNGEKVYYYSAGHSAKTTETPGIVISKWGSGPLVQHKVRHCPYMGYTLRYYQIPMSSPASVSKGTAVPVSTTLNISNASYSWSGDGNYVCAAGSSMNGSVTGLNTTNSNQGKAYVSIHSPYSNTTVKGIAYLNVSLPPASPIISCRSTFVCASGRTFSLNYIPTGNTYTWSSSLNSHLHTSNSHTNPCTFTSISNGSDTVKVTLSTPCSSNIIPVTKYPVWSGATVFSSIYGPYSAPNHHDASFYVVPDSKDSIISYNWNLNPLNGNHLYPSGPNLIIAFYNTGNYQLLVNAINICGTGPIYWRGVYVYASNSLLISPNPASTTVNVTIVKDNTSMASDSTTSLTEAAISDDQTKYTVSIFNSFGTQFLSIQKTSNPFSLQVDNLQNGLYIVVVSDGKNEYSKQLVVKH